MSDDVRVRIESIDLPDDLVAECEQRAPDMSWSRLIADAITFALIEADEQHDLLGDQQHDLLGDQRS